MTPTLADPLRHLAMPDLEAELADAENCLWTTCDGAKRFDISDDAAFNCGGLGLTRMKVQGNSYRPDVSGAFVLVLGLWHPFEPGPDCPFDGEPTLVDLLAFDPRRPSVWWHRIGQRDHVIGDWQVGTGPCRTHTTPLSWLQADCRGSVNLGALERWRAAA